MTHKHAGQTGNVFSGRDCAIKQQAVVQRGAAVVGPM